MPALDLQALKQQIAERRLAPIYVFVGEDLKLIDRIVSDVEATVAEEDRAFAVERVYAGEPGGTPLQIVDSARMMPMLGDRRIVIVLRAERLLKPKRAAKAAVEDDDQEEAGGSGEPIDLGPMEDYVAAPVSSSTLIFVATEIDRTRRLTKRLVEKAAVVEFAGLSADNPMGRRDGRRSGLDWLNSELARAGRAIEPEAAQLLSKRAGNDITKLRGDVERLLLFAEGRKRITTDDVMEVVSESTEVDDEWAVVNAIADGDAARALSEVARRLDRGDSPHGLVGQLRWWVSSRLAEGDPSRVKAALDVLLRTDLALKSSGGDQRVLVERLVAELTGRALPQRGWQGRR